MPIRGPDCMPFDTGSARATMSWLSAQFSPVIAGGWWQLLLNRTTRAKIVHATSRPVPLWRDHGPNDRWNTMAADPSLSQPLSFRRD